MQDGTIILNKLNLVFQFDFPFLETFLNPDCYIQYLCVKHMLNNSSVSSSKKIIDLKN